MTVSLSTGSKVGLGIALLVLLSIINRIRAYRRLSHIPGPTLAKWSRYWMVKSNGSGRMHEVFYGTTKRYGSLCRIGPNHLITSDADLLRRMQAPRSRYRRAPWYGTFRFKPRADNIITYIDENKHDELRKKMSAGYGGKEVPQLEERIDRQLQIWIDKIRTTYISTATEFKPMDLARKAQFWALDVISDLAFNSAFGDVPEDLDKFDYIKTTEDGISAITMLSIFPHVHRWIEQSRLIDMLVPSAKDKTGFGRISGIAQERVRERFVDGKLQDREDMLGSFLRHGLSQTEAESETVLQIMAGSDTSATIIRAAFLNILTSPSILSKLRSEIDEGIANGQISSPVKDSEARKLTYLQAVIRETLRLWPPVQGLLLKVVPPEGDTFKGTFLPGGTFIGQSTWAMSRDVGIYGHDAALFRPSRWIDSAPEQISVMDKQADLGFGYGRFSCLGRPVAQMELNKVFVEILRNFELEIVYPDKPWDCEGRGVFLMKNFWVRVTERASGTRR
ncbi:cytochrome P450 [Venturia nashicola]|uniref:Cytochrome P450 n=1 Tax=Venturia nashicola TaxID=86259 RepID=A0A4Z1NHL5_9PEZI|nr:cytochrome P450 [Venturia nashicola]